MLIRLHHCGTYPLHCALLGALRCKLGDVVGHDVVEIVADPHLWPSLLAQCHQDKRTEAHVLARLADLHCQAMQLGPDSRCCTVDIGHALGYVSVVQDKISELHSQTRVQSAVCTLS